jgi:hypothetical protein
METDDIMTAPTTASDEDRDTADDAGEPGVVAVYAAPDPMTAEIVRAALEAEGIPALIGEQVTDAAPTLSVGEGFWGEVHVPASLAEEARLILQAIDEGRLGISEEELTEAAERDCDPGV